MPPVTETNDARPLTEAEKTVLRELLARDSAFSGPAVRTGEPYRALVNLSVPRRGDKDRGTDLVMAGETVYLTAEEAAQFNRTGHRDGRQIPVLQKLTGPDGSRAESPRVLPRMVSRRMFRPPAPEPGSDAARPDPEGSSTIQVMQDGGAPETAGAAAADPAELADILRSAPPQDAVDLPPRAARTRGRS